MFFLPFPLMEKEAKRSRPELSAHPAAELRLPRDSGRARAPQSNMGAKPLIIFYSIAFAPL